MTTNNPTFWSLDMTHELEESDNEVVDRLLAEIRVKDKLTRMDCEY